MNYWLYKVTFIGIPAAIFNRFTERYAWYFFMVWKRAMRFFFTVNKLRKEYRKRRGFAKTHIPYHITYWGHSWKMTSNNVKKWAANSAMLNIFIKLQYLIKIKAYKRLSILILQFVRKKINLWKSYYPITSVIRP